MSFYNIGWCYFRKQHHGKYHYVVNWRSLCGHYVVRDYEQRRMVFTIKEKLRQRKICVVCERLEHKVEIESMIDR